MAISSISGVKSAGKDNSRLDFLIGAVAAVGAVLTSQNATGLLASRCFLFLPDENGPPPCDGQTYAIIDRNGEISAMHDTFVASEGRRGGSHLIYEPDDPELWAAARSARPNASIAVDANKG